MKNLGHVKHFGSDIQIKQTEYADGRIALQLIDMEDGGPYATFSVNLPAVALLDGEFLAKTWGENESLRDPMMNTGLFIDTGKREKSGFVSAEVWRLA